LGILNNGRHTVAEYLTELFNLGGKVGAVIGGGGHLCSEMARALARAGVKVAVLDANADAAVKTAEDIRAAGGEAMSLKIDATDKASHEAVLANMLSRYGQVDFLINGAGINAPTPVLDIKIDEWRAIMDSHVTATLFGCQVFGKHMLNRKTGSIINMASASSGPPLSKAFTYSAAKAGVMNLTQNIAREWGTQGVRVNALRPGFFPTEWNMKNFIDKSRNDAILGHTPMARYGEPRELVGAVLWLCSDAASFVTGSVVAVDGGFTCMTI
jgi:NAD(P)-dependent dehydrogenase (short-subunit alcohol dehydrogenase family)